MPNRQLLRTRPAKELALAPDLCLPNGLVTQTIGILARKGAGKTYTGAVIAEELLAASLQVVIADPVGVWHGLRSSADGQQEGLPIVVMGGDYGDVPLEVASSRLVAEFAVETGASVVLDLSHFRKGEQTRFMEAFCEALYELKARQQYRTPLHLILDEADALAPQKPMPGQQRLLGAIEDLVRRGRARGIGVMLITQRSAVLNKDVLTQVEILIVLRTISPQDRKAIDAWIEVHGTVEQRAELMTSLAALPTGEAWVWSPGWPTQEGIFRRVKVRRRRTFDSSATPEVGERYSEPRRRAPVDLNTLRARMAEVIERVQAEDPKVLRRHISSLERELAQLRSGQQVEIRTETVEVRVPVWPAEMRSLVVRARKQIDGLTALAMEMEAAISASPSATDSAGGGNTPDPPSRLALPSPETLRGARPPRVERGTRLSAGHQRLLDALAWLESVRITRANRTTLALLAGYTSAKGGYFTNLVSSLRSTGAVEYGTNSTVFLTERGRALAHRMDVAPTSHELHEQLFRKLGSGRARILGALIDAYPRDLARDELAATAGHSAGGGYFANLVSSLRSLGLIDYSAPGRVTALPVLFLSE